VASSHLQRLSSLRAFQHRSYVALWLGALVSNIGTWMETVAVGVFVTEATGRAAATGAVAAVMYLPAVVLSPIGGALADRFDRRRYLAVMTSAQAVVASLIATLAFLGRLTVPSVAFLAFLTGCLNTLLYPAFTALLAELVPADPLPASMLWLRDRCAALMEREPADLMQVLVSRYPPGAGIGWHRDAPMFESRIVGVSLLAPCRMRFRRTVGGVRSVAELELAPRSA